MDVSVVPRLSVTTQRMVQLADVSASIPSAETVVVASVEALIAKVAPLSVMIDHLYV